jgi:hypothetical protein
MTMYGPRSDRERSEPGREEALAPKARSAGVRRSSPSDERGERARRRAERALEDVTERAMALAYGGRGREGIEEE